MTDDKLKEYLLNLKKETHEISANENDEAGRLQKAKHDLMEQIISWLEPSKLGGLISIENDGTPLITVKSIDGSGTVYFQPISSNITPNSAEIKMFYGDQEFRITLYRGEEEWVFTDMKSIEIVMRDEKFNYETFVELFKKFIKN
jgi:hypothetical protein